MTKKKEVKPRISSVGNKNSGIAVQTTNDLRPVEFPEGCVASFEPVPCYDYSCVVVRDAEGEVCAVFRGLRVDNVCGPRTRLR